MDFSDERYVKVYTRDTLTWLGWGWEARAVFALLLRKVDGAGIIETGTMEPAEALALQLRMPTEVCAKALPELIAAGTVERVKGGLVVVRFVEAQEATKTEARKKQDQRQRNRDQRRASREQTPEVVEAPVPQCPPVSRAVPDCPPPAQPPAQPSPPPPPEEEAPSSSAKLVPVVRLISPPTTEPDTWTGEDFWRWAQGRRQAGGLVPEKMPGGLGGWWSEARMLCEADVLKAAFMKFGASKHWEAADPPYPFAAFRKNWMNFVPQGGLRATAR